MKTVYFSILAFIFVLSACGPAAEDRQLMHSRARVFQDSIANFIRTSMQEAESTVDPSMQPAPAPAGTTTNATPGQQNPPANITPSTQPANMGVNQAK